MILHILCVSVLMWSPCKCEPPVNSYLPPSNNGVGRPSTQYGPPERDGGNNFGDNRPSQPGFGHLPQNNYLPPEQSGVTKPDTRYSSPTSDNFDQNPSQNREGVRPNSQYGSPNQGVVQSSRLTENEYSLSSSSGGSDFNNVGKFNSRGPAQRPFYNTQTPSEHNQIHTNGFPPNHESARSEGPSSRFQEERPVSPISSYGVPSVDRTHGGHRPNFGEEDTGEPAKYEFNYEVDDSLTGTKFGHSEHRDGDLATGEYNVVLPDGRKQVVEYEADLDGFKPQIRYEGTPQVGSQGSDRGHHGSSKSDAFLESNHSQPGIFGQYQNTNIYANDENIPTQGEAGYLSGSRPGNTRNKQRNGYSDENSRQRAPNQGYPGSNDSLTDFNGNNEGYPRCTNGNNGGQERRGCYGSGGDGQPQNGYNNSPLNKEGYDGSEGFNGNNQGYPRCPNVNNGGQQERGCSGSMGDGRPQNGYNNNPHNEEGYPSSRPKGPVGTGY